MKKFHVGVACLIFLSLSVWCFYLFLDGVQKPRFYRVNYSHRRLSVAPANQSHDKWIIITSIAPPTDDVRYLASLEGWKVVVAGDLKSPSNWSYPNCIFLSIADQENLGVGITRLLPTKSYSRKNVAYLYAIAHGAKIIYETDDDNRPLDKLHSFAWNKTTTALMFAGRGVFNPYQHFGQSTLWPRGYPLSAIGAVPQRFYRMSYEWTTPLIQQGLVNGDPDMDAIFRLTRKSQSSPLQVKFDPVAPPAIVPPGVFTPFNSQNTLFHYKALWATLLPITTTFRICDIWRGYWAQRLLWEIGGTISFMPANAYQQRNAHSFILDAEDENEMYRNTERLQQFLAEWECPGNLRFFQCVVKLSSDMADKEFWGHEDVAVAKQWLEDLTSIGYHEPERVKVNRTSWLKCSVNKGGVCLDDIVPNTTHNTATRVDFHPAEQRPPQLVTDATTEMTKISRQMQMIFAICPRFNISTHNLTLRKDDGKGFFDDILLLVVFNFPFYRNILYLEATYSTVFPNIAYCGDNYESFKNETRFLMRNVTFIETPVIRGHLGYLCTLKAMRMGYNVTGIMVVGDDVLVNVWSLVRLDKFRIWKTYSHRLKVRSKDWVFLKTEFGTRAVVAAIKDINNITNPPEGVQHPKTFSQMVRSFTNINNDEILLRGLADFYYIPSKFFRDFDYYGSIFYKHRVHLELAVPLTLYGLQRQEKMHYLHGSSLWNKERKMPFKKFNERHHYLHPVKLSMPENVANYCNIYLRKLLREVYFDTK